MGITAQVQPVSTGAQSSPSIWRSPWLNGKLFIGLAIFLIMIGVEPLAPLVYDTHLALMGSSPTNVVPVWVTHPPRATFKPADPAHPLGTESQGRDMLAVLIVGTPRTLRVGLIGAGIGMVVGVALGFTAGLLGGWIDMIIGTTCDAVISIPGLAVLVVIASYISQLEVNSMALIMALFAWPLPARAIRAQILSMRERDFIKMAVLSGASKFDIMFKEIMPNLLPYLAASFTGTVSAVILAATGLETLGLGPTRIPTLGMTINGALRSTAIFRGMWWWWGPPIVVLIVIFVGLFLMTIGLDEIANPRLRGLQS
jgi:peptide/nickel transport system permease protein